jgi:ABC-type transport system involved in multi-copper enzyme maturation permease subunit
MMCITFAVSSIVLGGYQYRKQIDTSKSYQLAGGWQGPPTLNFARRPPVLAVFGAGLDPVLGTHFILREGARGGPQMALDPQLVDPERLFGVLGPFDFEQVVVVLLSLVALLLAYDAIAGEREQGTLALALANPLPRDTLLAGKVLGGCAVLLVPLALGGGLGLGAASLLFELPWGAEEAVRALAIFVLAGVYLGLFYVLGLVISVRSRSAAASLAVCLLAWATLVLVVPGLCGMGAQALRRTLSIGELQSRRNAFWQEVHQAMGVAYSEEFRQARKAGRDLDYDRLRKIDDVRSQEAATRIQAMEADYRTRMQGQMELVRTLAWATPVLSCRFSLDALAQTGWADQVRFLSTIHLLELKPKSGQPPRAPLVESMAEAAGEVAMLVATSVLLFAAAFWSFRRCSVQ